MGQKLILLLGNVLEKIQGLSNKQKYASFGAIIILIVSAFVWYVALPKRAEINQLKEEVAALNVEINIRQTKARQLEALIKESRILQQQLVELEKRLPSEAEVETLLKQVAELGERTGLLVKLWKPQDRRLNPSGIYTEIPMAVEVTGGYHSLGFFFEKIGELYRIVNISSIKMGDAKMQSGRFSVESSFLATTFSVVENATTSTSSATSTPSSS